MNISLTPNLEDWIKQKVSSGRYHSASEVVREALRLLEEYDRVRSHQLQDLQKEIQLGIQSGPSAPLDMQKIKHRAKTQRNRSAA